MKTAAWVWAALVAGLAGWPAARGQLSRVTTMPTTGTAPATMTSSPGVTFSWITHEIDYRLAEPEQLVAAVLFAPDPALRLAYVETVIAADKAVDDLGRSLVRQGPASIKWPGNISPSSPSSGPVIREQVLIALQAPPAGPEAERSRTIRYIEGVIPASVIVKTDTVELTAPGKATRTYGGVKATFTATMENATECKFDYSFELPEGTSREERIVLHTQLSSLKVQVVDASGAVWQEHDATGTDTDSAFRTKMGFRAPPDTVAGTPLKVSFEIAETKPTKIPFRLENIPLP